MGFRMLALAFGATALLGGAALADPVIVGDLTISDGWTRATPPGAPTAGGYFTVTNHGSDDDTLVAVASPIAASAELHVMALENGVMTMRAVDGGIAIPAGKAVTLAPDGLHIMFVTLAAPLRQGGTVPVTLTFAKAGSVEINLPVLAIGSKGPTASSGMSGM